MHLVSLVHPPVQSNPRPSMKCVSIQLRPPPFSRVFLYPWVIITFKLYIHIHFYTVCTVAGVILRISPWAKRPMGPTMKQSTMEGEDTIFLCSASRYTHRAWKRSKRSKCTQVMAVILVSFNKSAMDERHQLAERAMPSC